MKKILLFIIVIANIAVNAQSKKDFDNLFNKRIDEIRNNRGFYGYNYMPFVKAFPDYVLKSTEKYQKDTLLTIKMFVLELMCQIMFTSDNTEIKQKVCEQMLDMCYDKDINIRKYVSANSKRFYKDDFSYVSRKKIVNFFDLDIEMYKHFIKIAGYLQIIELKDKLTNIISDPTIKDFQTKWDARLALARMGDEYQANYCTDWVRSKGVNNNVVMYFFPDLVYTRNKGAIEYLIEQLNSDERNIYPSNPDNDTKIVCGYRVMEQLAPIIKDYPYQYYETTKQLKTNDYIKALADIRLWFKNNPNYTILTDKF